jgi:hypothetical protein
MTYDDALVERLAGWRPEGTGPHSLAHTGENGWTVGVTAESTDTVGGRLTEIAVTRPAPDKPATATSLKKWAGRVADRATGLLEPLKLIEVDGARAEAVLRSETPAVRGNSVEYYEVLLRGRRSASLKRYRATRSGSGKRRAVPFALTHEAIAKVAGDLTGD